jgi:hypothetical protein
LKNNKKKNNNGIAGMVYRKWLFKRKKNGINKKKSNSNRE